MKESKFKKGDIVRPIEGRKTSNLYPISSLKKLKVVDEYRNLWNNKREMVLVILEGSSMSGWSRKVQGDDITLFEDAFELVEPEEMDYEIY